VTLKRRVSITDLRSRLGRMTDNEVIRTARGAIDELTARGILKCIPALVVIDALSDEKIHRRT